MAANAKEAGQRLLDPSGYDAIVLDVMLPDVNGFELCKKFREAGNFVPVIMLTARSSPEDRVLGDDPAQSFLGGHGLRRQKTRLGEHSLLGLPHGESLSHARDISPNRLTQLRLRFLGLSANSR